MNIYPDIYEGDYPVKMDQLKQYGRILIRCMYGKTNDTKFKMYWQRAKELGMKRQAYQRLQHYGGLSPSYQAGLFAQRLKRAIPYEEEIFTTPHEFDLEQKPGEPPLPEPEICFAIIQSAVHRFINEGFDMPWVYINLYTYFRIEAWKLNMPIHLAYYPTRPVDMTAEDVLANIMLPDKYKVAELENVVAWQFTDSAEGYPAIAAHHSDWNVLTEDLKPKPEPLAAGSKKRHEAV